MNCYFLVPNVAFLLHCFSKMLLEKSANQVLASVKVFQITLFLHWREKGQKPLWPGEKGKPISQETVGF